MSEFIDKVYDDLPSVTNRKLGEALHPAIVRIGQELAETGGQREISRIQRHFYGINPEAVMIALRLADENNELDLDETDGVARPPRVNWTKSSRFRYM